MSDTFELTSDLLLDARCEFHDLLELLGTASSQLRDAASDADMGDTQKAMKGVDNCVRTLVELGGKVSEVATMALRWKSWAEEALMKGDAQ